MLFKVIICSVFRAPLKGGGSPPKTERWQPHKQKSRHTDVNCPEIQPLPAVICEVEQPCTTTNTNEILKLQNTWKRCAQRLEKCWKFFHWYKYFTLVVNNPRLKEKKHYPRVGVFGQLVCIKINSSKLGHSLFVLVQLTRKFFFPTRINVKQKRGRWVGRDSLNPQA